jgi:hypothetical protein
VALSPQRIVAAHTTMDSTDPDASDALIESELLLAPLAEESGGSSSSSSSSSGSSELAFTIIGAANETVSITVVAPASSAGHRGGEGSDTPSVGSADNESESRLARAMAGKVVVVTATLAESGEAAVSCSAGACHVALAPPPPAAAAAIAAA